VLALRGRLGFNVTWLFETGEETGSPGLAAFCAAQREALQADVLIASDGPRLSASQPTVFLGSRGVVNFDLALTLRDGAHHSGNWGGLLRNPGTVLANAIASLVDARGRILIEALRPPPIPANVRAALAGLAVGGGDNDPVVDADWGEPGLTPAERVFGWNTLEVLAFRTGNPEHPVNAIPATAQATLHLRFVVGTDVSRLAEQVQAHLAALGFPPFEISVGEVMHATRLDPDNPWVHFTLASIERSTGAPPVLLPNLGGSLPNDVFAGLLGLPTVWIPHSYPGCQQHAPDEHLLRPVAREALQLMAGLFWATWVNFSPPIPGVALRASFFSSRLSWLRSAGVSALCRPSSICCATACRRATPAARPPPASVSVMRTARPSCGSRPRCTSPRSARRSTRVVTCGAGRRSACRSAWPRPAGWPAAASAA
jgi:acetylornithine deacetylase/succinyl-diaminopimelate desuccinylase-like protein